MSASVAVLRVTPQESTQRDLPDPDSEVPFEGRPHRTAILPGPVPRGMHPSDLKLVLAVYRRAAAALEIPHPEIRRDFLTGCWIEAVADFRSGAYFAAGMAEADAELRADRLIKEVLEAMDNGQEWLQNRIAACEQMDGNGR